MRGLPGTVSSSVIGSLSSDGQSAAISIAGGGGKPCSGRSLEPISTLTTATLAVLLAEFPFGTPAVEQYRQIFAAMYVSLCRAAGRPYARRPYAREVANQALCDAINNRVVAHSVAVKFLQSLNGPAKMAHCRLTVFGNSGAFSAAAYVDPITATQITVALVILASVGRPPTLLFMSL
jgi:hypothetical protein